MKKKENTVPNLILRKGKSKIAALTAHGHPLTCLVDMRGGVV